MAMSESQQVSITPERNSSVLRKVGRWFQIPALRTTFGTMLRVPTTDLYAPGKKILTQQLHIGIEAY